MTITLRSIRTIAFIVILAAVVVASAVAGSMFSARNAHAAPTTTVGITIDPASQGGITTGSGGNTVTGGGAVGVTPGR